MKPEEKFDGPGSTRPSEGGDTATGTDNARPSTADASRYHLCGGYRGEAEQLRSVGSNHPATVDEITRVLRGIDREVNRVTRIRGWLKFDDPLRATAIMCEEAGEALKASLDLTRTTVERNKSKDLGDLAELLKEVEHTASSCIMLLVNIEREIARRREQW